MNINLKKMPESEPVSVAVAKQHLLITANDQDEYIESLIQVARQWVEEYTGRPLITQTWLAKGRQFCSRIDLLPSLQGVTSVKYLDADKALQVLDAEKYVVVNSSLLGSVFSAYGYSWPLIYQHPEAVEIEFVAGYGAASDVPKPIVQAILLKIGHLYENREETSPLTLKEVPMGVGSLLNSYQVPVIR